MVQLISLLNFLYLHFNSANMQGGGASFLYFLFNVQFLWYCESVVVFCNILLRPFVRMIAQ